MELARLGTSKVIPRIQQRLNLFRDVLHDDGISVDIGEQQLGKSAFYCCYLKTNNVVEICRYQLAETVADIITEILQGDYIRRILRCHYTGFDRTEEGTICAEAQFLAHNPRWRRRIIFALLDYLSNHICLHVDGFVRFRLPDYWEELVDCVDIAVNNFQDRKEHEEFVNLLRFFVDVQEPRLETVQVMPESRGGYVLLDVNHQPVDDRLLCGLSLECNGSGVSQEDLLLSALVTLSPSTIVLHCREEDSFNTIGEVFSQRMQYCPGCAFCSED